MASRWVEINCSLRLCRKVFAILKQKNPDLVPDYVDILAYRKNNKKCHIHDACRKLGIEDNALGNWIAHFDDRGEYNESTDEWETAGHRPHVCLKQHVLFFPLTFPTGNVPKKQMHWVQGNWSLIEIMCHELTHPTHLGHGKKFLSSITNSSPKWHRWSFLASSTTGIQYSINQRNAPAKPTNKLLRQESG